MSYTPTTWKDGDLVTSAKLNKIENGIVGASGLFIIHEEWQEENNEYSLTDNVSYNDVKNALLSGKLPILLDIYDEGISSDYFSSIDYEDDTYRVIFKDTTLIAEDPDEPLQIQSEEENPIAT